MDSTNFVLTGNHTSAKSYLKNLTVCSNRQIDGEDFVNFCGLLRKHELYVSRAVFI